MSIYEEMAVKEWPNLIKVNQVLPRPLCDHVQDRIRAMLCEDKFSKSFHRGDRVAIALGSRKIDNYNLIVHEVIKRLKEIGAVPFIISAMGSHGGACREGQKAVFDSLGITESSMNVPIEYDLEWERIGTSSHGIPVYFSKHAYRACDGIILINRIKRHTNFRGAFESGLMKMLVVGLGKHKGALTVHSYGFENMSDNIEDIGRFILKNAKVKIGIGIIENGYDETACVELLTADEILKKEPELLAASKVLSPRLPFDKIDLLAIKRMGKDISGDGMDTNVIGRYSSDLTVDYTATPVIRRIAVFDLTEKSHGSAVGVGYADVITKKLRDKIDMNVSYTNSITATATAAVKIPIVMPNERKALEAALKTCAGVDKTSAGICIINDTLNLQEMYVTKPMLRHIHKRCDIKISDLEEPFIFNDKNELNISF